VAISMTNFPLLAYVNEPVSHFTSAAVRPIIKMLTDTFHEQCSVTQNISLAQGLRSPYVCRAGDIPRLSAPLPLHLLVPNDGDGIIELLRNHHHDDPLRGAVFHRMFGIDAPELFCTSFINVNGKIMKRHNGHLSHLAVHYYLGSFASSQGTAVVCKEMPRYGTTPTDHHGRELSVFWFVWSGRPQENELAKIDEIISILDNSTDAVRGCLMSTNINPRQANDEHPFFLNVNALLVLSGFSHVYTK